MTPRTESISVSKLRVSVVIDYVDTTSACSLTLADIKGSVRQNIIFGRVLCIDTPDSNNLTLENRGLPTEKVKLRVRVDRPVGTMQSFYPVHMFISTYGSR